MRNTERAAISQFRLVRTFCVAVSFSALLALATLSCTPKPPETDARSELEALLRNSLGKPADPKVAFLVNGNSRDTHLYVLFDTLAFRNQSDSSFQLAARDLATFSMRHYEKADHLDSITVAARKEQSPGLYKVYHTRAFSIAELRQGASR